MITTPSKLSLKLAEETAYTESVVSNNSKGLVKEHYIKLMMQLEKDGIPKQQISTVGSKILLKKKKELKREQGGTALEIDNITIGGHWFAIARELGYVNLQYSRPKITLSEDGVKISHYAAKGIPEMIEENKEYIDLVYRNRNFLNNVLDMLFNEPFASLIDKKENKLALHDWNAILDNSESLINNKTKVPPNTVHILLRCMAQNGIRDGFIEYFKTIHQYYKLTQKQFVKYKKGMQPEQINIFNPRTKDLAIIWNYFGTQCPECKSWRVIETETQKFTVSCLDCHNIFSTKRPFPCHSCGMMFYDDEIKELKTKCANCGEEFPEKILEYIKK